MGGGEGDLARGIKNQERGLLTKKMVFKLKRRPVGKKGGGGLPRTGPTLYLGFGGFYIIWTEGLGPRFLMLGSAKAGRAGLLVITEIGKLKSGQIVGKKRWSKELR